jgi:peptidoglycan hydrolase CwlO-like protein
MKKLLLVFVILLFFLWINPVNAVECEGTPPSGVGKEAEIQQYIDSCSQKITSLQGEQLSLKQTITTLNSKINLAQGQINQTQVQINQLEKEVDVLGGVLDTVNDSLGQLETIYTSRVRESYRRSRATPVDLIFSSDSIGDYYTKLKYLNTLKTKDQLILAELEKARNDYDQRKQDKVEKQQEVEELKAKLIAQKRVIDAQQAEKKDLLTLTQNDEKKFQKMLSDAKANLAALRRYVASQGGASILSNQTKCDSWGCYYNQRDSQWGNMGLGGSSYSVAEYGCLVSSVSMMASHAGKDIKPGDIAAVSSAFVPGNGWLRHSFSVNGINVTITAVSKSNLDSELNAGRSVIAGVYGGPDHFIVIVKKEGDKYIMHDPFLENGNNRDFSEKYSLSDINSLRLVSF